MHEKSKLPHTGRMFEVVVEGRTGDLSQRSCGYGNDMSRTSIEIDRRSRTSTEIDDVVYDPKYITTNSETREPESSPR